MKPAPEALVVTTFLGIFVGACAQSEGSASRGPRSSPVQPESSPHPTAATVNASPITTAELSSLALEAAGAVVLEETVLDRLLDQEVAAAGITIAPERIERERTLFFERIGADVNLSQEQAGILLERFKHTRGLGPLRFAAMLARNAKLRALIDPRSPEANERIESIVRSELGPKAKARIIVVSAVTEANLLRNQLETAPATERGALFGRLAFEYSRDPSAGRGGSFGPVAHDDLSMPPQVRAFLASPPGSLSPVTAIDSGLAIMLIDEQIPPAEGTDAQRTLARSRADALYQREAMDALAKQLLSEARVGVLNDSLRWSWENRVR